MEASPRWQIDQGPALNVRNAHRVLSFRKQITTGQKACKGRTGYPCNNMHDHIKKIPPAQFPFLLRRLTYCCGTKGTVPIVPDLYRHPKAAVTKSCTGEPSPCESLIHHSSFDIVIISGIVMMDNKVDNTTVSTE